MAGKDELRHYILQTLDLIEQQLHSEKDMQGINVFLAAVETRIKHIEERLVHKFKESEARLEQDDLKPGSTERHDIKKEEQLEKQIGDHRNSIRSVATSAWHKLKKRRSISLQMEGEKKMQLRIIEELEHTISPEKQIVYIKELIALEDKIESLLVTKMNLSKEILQLSENSEELFQELLSLDPAIIHELNRLEDEEKMRSKEAADVRRVINEA